MINKIDKIFNSYTYNNKLVISHSKTLNLMFERFLQIVVSQIKPAVVTHNPRIMSQIFLKL